jgi:hypothetical protein
VINQLEGSPALLRNVNPDHHHWVGLKLIGAGKSPPDGIGTTVYLTIGGVRQRRDVISGGSFASSNDQRLHFGLGDATSVDQVEIHWPDKVVQRLKLSAGIDHYYSVEEGKDAAALVP